jgi:hypothetical protein
MSKYVHGVAVPFWKDYLYGADPSGFDANDRFGLIQRSFEIDLEDFFPNPAKITEDGISGLLDNAKAFVEQIEMADAFIMETIKVNELDSDEVSEFIMNDLGWGMSPQWL